MNSYPITVTYVVINKSGVSYLKNIITPNNFVTEQINNTGIWSIVYM